MSNFKNRVRANMNSSKALSLMGFGRGVNIDDVLGEDPTETLNKAIFGQMESLLTKKREATEELVRVFLVFRVAFVVRVTR
jgi:hypothetical protein